jgi:hypothetical protein
MTTPIQVLDVVALGHDRPGDGLVRGQVGTIVEELSAGVFEVEFSDDEMGCHNCEMRHPRVGGDPA